MSRGGGEKRWNYGGKKTKTQKKKKRYKSFGEKELAPKVSVLNEENLVGGDGEKLS